MERTCASLKYLLLPIFIFIISFSSVSAESYLFLESKSSETNLLTLGNTYKAQNDIFPASLDEALLLASKPRESEYQPSSAEPYWYVKSFVNLTEAQNWILYIYGGAFESAKFKLYGLEGTQSFALGHQHYDSDRFHYAHSVKLQPNHEYVLVGYFDSPYYYAPIKMILQAESVLANKLELESVAILILSGICLSLALYNLFVYIGARDKTNLYYALYVVFLLWSWLHILHVPEVLFNFYDSNYHWAGFLLAGIFSNLFVVSFLRLQDTRPKLTKFCYTAAAISFICLPFSFMSENHGLALTTASSTLNLFLGLYAGISSWRKGYRPAKFFVFAYLALFSPNFASNLVNAGLIENQTLNLYLIGFMGGAIDALLLAFAVADKVRLLNEENIALNTNLEKKVLERTAELQKTTEELARANDSKSRFLAQMSHEIRTPMNAVIGLSQLALKTNLNFEQRDYLQKIYHSGDVLLGIINDILDYSKIEAGRLNVEKVSFNLERVVERATNVCSLKAHAKGIELIVDLKNNVPKFIESDPLRIQQVLVNLISNAVKFTEHGHVNLRINTKEQTDGEYLIEFAVVDTGMGMSEEQQKLLFKPFSQADDTITRKFGGTGLGLAISKQLVELMGGDIWVNSKQGLGSAFHFSIKCKKTHEDIPANSITVEDRPLRVLVVDDNAIARRVLLDIFTHHSALVIEAENGIQAIDKVQTAVKNNQKFDLIVMDWRMPEMDGIQASKLIRQDLGVKDMPAILMVSAYDKDEAKVASEGVGIDGFIEKPVNQSTLFDMLQTCLNLDVKRSELIEMTWSGDESIDLSNVSVLLVEDNKLNRQVAVGFLKEANVQIDIAENGIEAIDKVMRNNYDLVLMDIQMPEMDGLTATREIRSLDKFKNLPIIAMTAHAMAGDSKKSLNAGMNDHLTKPVDPDELYRVIYKWVDKAKVKPATSSEEATPELAELQSLSLLNVAKALKQMQGRTSLYLDLIKTFVEENHSTASELELSSSSDDMEQLYLKVHSLKSNAAYVGAEELATTAAQLEQAITNKQDHQMLLVKTCNKLTSLLEQLTPFVQSFFKQEIDLGSFTQVEVDEMLKNMTELLKESNAEVEDFIPKLQQLQYHVENRNVIAELIQCIDDIEYDAAIALIGEHRQAFELSA
ncbi:response regulator [Catenovulum sp. SX2]|uniref:response regulator n=1 Tax=Catenovulum sp. SX2 TaxID=3398614 RepID=UPI003F82C89C